MNDIVLIATATCFFIISCIWDIVSQSWHLLTISRPDKRGNCWYILSWAWTLQRGPASAKKGENWYCASKFFGSLKKKNEISTWYSSFLLARGAQKFCPRAPFSSQRADSHLVDIITCTSVCVVIILQHRVACVEGYDPLVDWPHRR